MQSVNLTVKWHLLLAQARVHRDLGAPRVYLLMPAAKVLGCAHWQVTLLHVTQLLYQRAQVLVGVLVLVLSSEEALFAQRGLYVAVFALWSQGRQPAIQTCDYWSTLATFIPLWGRHWRVRRGSASFGWWLKPVLEDLNLTPMVHMVEENWLLQIVFWPSHIYHGMCVPMHIQPTKIKCHKNKIKFNWSLEWPQDFGWS